MSDIADEELLNDEEFDYEGYDLGCEEEDALLEDEKDYEKDYGSGDEEFKEKGGCSEKKDSVSDTDEQEDILNLDIEEDFQVEDKEELIERKKEGKFKIERSQSPTKIVTTKIVPKPFNKTDSVAKPEQTVRRVPLKVNNRGRRGVGRGNFQTRANFPRNNPLQKDRRPMGRRNGTVFINPKYEGFVQVNENNARLAWDNYGQNNSYIQPWASGVVSNDITGQNPNMVLNNLVGIAATFSQSPNLLQLAPTPQPQPVLNFEPPPNVFQNQVPFQPVPNAQNSQPAFHNPVPVPPHQPPFPPYPSAGPQQFNSAPPSSNYGFYGGNNTQNYNAEPPKPSFVQPNFNRNPNYKFTKTNVVNEFDSGTRITFKNDFYKQNNYQSGDNFSYNPQGNYQNKNSYNQNPKMNSQNFNYGYNQNRNTTNRQDNCNANWTLNNFQQRNQNFKNDNFPNYNRKTNYKTQNRQFAKGIESDSKLRRSILNTKSEVKPESPEKKLKMEENSEKTEENKQVDLIKTEKVEQSSASNPQTAAEEEDEEMRLYRLKIEEQKREREKVLKRKEERRRMMLLQQKTEEEKAAAAAPEKSNSEPPQTVTVVNRPKLTNQQRSVNQIPVLTGSAKPQQNSGNISQSGLEDSPPNLTFKIKNNLSRKVPEKIVKNELSSGSFPPPERAGPEVTKKESCSNFMSDRVVVVKNKTDSNNSEKSGVSSDSSVGKSNDSESADHVGQGLSSFFNNRKVLKKDNSLLATRLVVISNLSAGTTPNKLAAMSRGIGEIQKLRLDKQERQATILFKSVASAHAFFKKYQRHMLDLSMIQVKLEPML